MRAFYLSTLLVILTGFLYAQSSTKKIELEISGSESINTALSFKFGRSNIYGIVSGGIIRIDDLKNSAVGLGVGTQRSYEKGWSNEVELLAYSMNRDGSFKGELSMLSQIKLTIGKQLTSHFKAYGGPVLNLTILKNKESNGDFSNDIAPYSIWSNKKDDVKMDMWVGLVAGFRF